MDFYNYTYLYANGYLEKFRGFFNNPGLTYQGLTAILKTFYKHKGWRMYKDDKGEHTIWYKGDLDKILENRNFYLPQFQKVCFDKWDKNKIRKEWEKEPAIDYSSEASNMDKISQNLITQDNYGYGEVDESLEHLLSEMHNGPEYPDLMSIYYEVMKDEDGDTVYRIKEFETYKDGTYNNFNMDCDEDDLIYYFGENVAHDIANGAGELRQNNYTGEKYMYIDYDNEQDIDVSNIEQVNSYAKKMYGVTENFKHAGFLLTTGELLDFGGGAGYLDPRGIDHHNLNINGLDLYGFIALGNIRISPEGPGFEFCKTPTKEQVRVINAFIRQFGYKKGYFLVDRVNENGNNVWDKEYEVNEFGNIVRDITSSNPQPEYTSQFKDFLQEKKMGKKIYITEKQLKHIIKETTEIKYHVDPKKVMIVKKYLDDNFIKGGISQIGEDGYPTTLPIVALKGTDGQVAKNMTDRQLFYLLQDKYSKMYSELRQTNKFLQQIIKDWYYDKISKEGLLSVNEY